MNHSFDQLPLKTELLQNLRELQFNTMTPIQAVGLPELLKGVDVIAKAKTGSGKTAAFGLSILNSLDIQQKQIQALVICPTRELAEQVAKEIRMLARNLPNIKVLTLCGGSNERDQERSLESGAQIVVGTPGRLHRLLEKNSLDLSKINSLTLDEADRMLDMGFYDKIIEIVSHLPKKRQSLLFSATYPENILKLSEKIQNSAIEIKIDSEEEANEIAQVFYEVQPEQDKNDFLYKLLCLHQPDRALIFCRMKKESSDVAQFFIKRGIAAVALNSDLEQNQRTEALLKFSNRSLSVLVATDIAGRGIDVEELPMVINYNMPSGPDAYVHRIGRTGRAGHKGLAFSFFNPAEQYRLDEIKELTQTECIIANPLEIMSSKKYKLQPPMNTIYISGGKKDKLRPGDIVGAIINEAKIEASGIGDISILDNISYVAIKPHLVGQVLEKLGSGKIKKRKFKMGTI